MAKYAFAVFTEPVAGQEEEFNRWYDQQHLGDVLKVDGLLAAQRFRLEPEPGAAPGAPTRYLAIYEMETDDPAATMAALTSRANTPAMPISEAMNGAAVKTYLGKAIGERKVARPA
jgi:hypothetical protein